ncbi:urea amidolyase associated protein UAAP1 [Methyloligella solikamskensis]|uniref:Urea amidolyase associated protein UAAP1 n=1 Tax=Methyloligella solikamskensis TaxID=1177756 RepID=A0ABW3JCC8_9HYPH
MTDQSPDNASTYDALRAKGRAAPARRRTLDDAELATPKTLNDDQIVYSETLEGGGQTSFVVRKGQVLRLINPEGRGSLSMVAVNFDLPEERLNTPDTAKVQWNAFLGKSMLILSDMGRALFSIIEDTNGHHDLILGGSAPKPTAAKYGGEPFLRNSRDNFELALAKFGLGRESIVPSIAFFAGVDVAEDGSLSFVEGSGRPGDFIDLRAEMNVLVALSNCPHPLNPDSEFNPPPMSLSVWQQDGDLPLDNETVEAERAFDNTRSFMAQLGR